MCLAGELQTLTSPLKPYMSFFDQFLVVLIHKWLYNATEDHSCTQVVLTARQSGQVSHQFDPVLRFLYLTQAAAVASLFCESWLVWILKFCPVERGFFIILSLGTCPRLLWELTSGLDSLMPSNTLSAHQAEVWRSARALKSYHRLAKTEQNIIFFLLGIVYLTLWHKRLWRWKR